jgi:hypothetical protein
MDKKKRIGWIQGERGYNHFKGCLVYEDCRLTIEFKKNEK